MSKKDKQVGPRRRLYRLVWLRVGEDALSVLVVLTDSGARHLMKLGYLVESAA